MGHPYVYRLALRNVDSSPARPVLSCVKYNAADTLSSQFQGAGESGQATPNHCHGGVLPEGAGPSHLLA